MRENHSKYVVTVDEALLQSPTERGFFLLTGAEDSSGRVFLVLVILNRKQPKPKKTPYGCPLFMPTHDSDRTEYTHYVLTT